MKFDSVQFRTRIIGAAFFAFAALLIGRLYLVQVVHGSAYQADAAGQYKQQAPDTDRRGAIFFTGRDGETVSAAVMQTGWRIAIKPGDLDGADRTYQILSESTTIDRDRFFASAAKTDDPYEEIVTRVDDVAASGIRARKLPGVLLVRDQWRFYPARELGAQVVGFVAYKGDRKTGVYGIERQWQDTLTKETDGLYVNPFAEIFANVEALLSRGPSGQQGDVVTTIEPSVQRQLEITLEGVMKEYSPRLAGAIVMDPSSGEIIAMALRPTFDPNTYNTVDDPSVYANQLVEGRYEQGSIMKPLTVAAGLDTGAISLETKYNDIGCMVRSEKRICNFDHKARGVVPMQEVLSQSLNLGVTFIEERMGQEVFRRYLHEFGLDTKTGIDLPNEVVGSLGSVDAEGASDVDFASASFGQGVAVSPIAMTRALAALANGGVLPQPHVVSAVRLENGLTKKIIYDDEKRVLKPETAETVTRMLVKVVDEALLKGVLKQEHYSIAAKTGTAQMATPGGGGYSEDRFLHSFFGYFPAHDPKFIIFMFAVEPHGAEFASATLARPFMDMTRFLIHYYDIPPDR